jgi:hypothetical protein
MLGAMAFAFTLSGRLLVGALRLRWLLPFESTRAAASAILGTAACVVAFDRLSGVGMHAPRIAMLLALGHVGLLAAVVVRGDLRSLRPVGGAVGWIGLLTAVSLMGGLALLPLLRGSGYNILNDTYTYCAFSEWLQGHAFGIATHYDAASPVSAIPVLWQQTGFPLGASYMLALVQACTGSLSVVIYPVVSAWGTQLALGGIWVMVRWGLRLHPAWAVAGVCAFALLPHSGYWAHHYGFLSQTYSVPALLLAIAVMSRAARGRRGSLSTVVLLALLAAYMITVYIPFLPLMGAAGLGWIVTSLRRVRAGRYIARWLWLHAATAALFLLLAGLDLRPALRGLPYLATANVGFPIPLSPFELLSFGMATGSLDANLRLLAPPWLVHSLATAAMVFLAVLGLAQATRRSRSAPLLAVLVILVALVGYYALVARDPWSGETGHTWSLFKAVQWAFPLIFLLQLAGAARLARGPGGRAVLLLLVVAPLSLSAMHWAWGEELGFRMRGLIRATEPLLELPRVKRAFESLPPGTLLLLGRPANQSVWLAAYAALLAYPRPIVGDWAGSASIIPAPQEYATSLAGIGKPGVVPLRWGIPPTADLAGAEPLGGGFARLVDLDRPRLVDVAYPWGPAPGASVASLQVGPGRVRGRLKLVFFAPRELEANLQLVGEAEASALSLAFQVVPGALDGPALQAAMKLAPPSTLTGRSPLLARVKFGRGWTTVILTPPPGSVAKLRDVSVVGRLEGDAPLPRH